MDNLQESDLAFLAKVETSCMGAENESKRTELMNVVKDFTNVFYDACEKPIYKDTAKQFNELPLDEQRKQLVESLELSEEPTDVQDVMKTFQEVFHDKTGPALFSHSTFFGYIAASGNFIATMGEFLTALQQFQSLRTKAGSCIEELVLRWMSNLIGFPSESQGVLTTGTSMAAVMAFAVARDEKLKSADNFNRAVIYVTVYTHQCHEKALNMVGLRNAITRRVPVNDLYEMDTEALDAMISTDKQNGLLPFLVVGTLGSLCSGSIDPLSTISDIAERNGIWFHVDAAYGGSFLVLENFRKLADGVNKCDSIGFDFHKLMSQPIGTGGVIVRKGEMLKSSMAITGHSYDTDTLYHINQYEIVDYTFELARPIRALPVWWSLKVLGINFFREHHQEKLLLARYFFTRVSTIPNIEVGPPPVLSVILFRFCPPGLDATVATKALQQEIVNDCRVYLTTMDVNGTLMLRVCVSSLRSHLRHVDLCLKVIEEKVKDFTVPENGTHAV